MKVYGKIIGITLIAVLLLTLKYYTAPSENEEIVQIKLEVMHLINSGDLQGMIIDNHSSRNEIILSKADSLYILNAILASIEVDAPRDGGRVTEYNIDIEFTSGLVDMSFFTRFDGGDESSYVSINGQHYNFGLDEETLNLLICLGIKKHVHSRSGDK